MEWVLNELEKDLFKEIANIGLSKAADALAVLSKEKVLLNVPDIHLVPPDQLVEVLSSDTDNTIVVHSEIRGDLEGKTLLLFSKGHVEKFISESVASLPEYDKNLVELQSSLLLEISNIITGSIVTQFANIFKLNIYGSVPQGPDNNVEESLKTTLKRFPAFQPLIFSIKTKFMNSGRLLELPLLIVFDTDTLLKLLSIIRSGDYANFGFLSKNPKSKV
jgi:chemotaxis protein CheC